jgi:hypothetical protein
MKVSMENDNNFGYEKIMILVDDIPLRIISCYFSHSESFILYVQLYWMSYTQMIW